MRVFFDHQIFSLQEYGGISRYFFELIKYLEKNNVKVESNILFSNNFYIKNLVFFNYKNFFKNINFKNKRLLIYLLNNIFSYKKNISLNYDIIHPTYYDDKILKYIENKSLVVTVHDMTMEKFPKYFSRMAKRNLNKKNNLIKRANKIIAISNNTKKDLIDILGVPEEKIVVIPHGFSYSNIEKNENNIKIILPKNFVLFVGKRDGYKNFSNFIKAFENILKENKDLELICIGGGAFTKKENELFREKNISERVKQLSVDDDTLFYTYKKSRLLVFPSLYEGFGLPILEAFANDCPVVCSNNSSFPEVAGDAALYFDPYDVESINRQLRSVLFNEDIASSLKLKGKERLKNFSWEKTGEQTLKLYKQILK